MIKVVNTVEDANKCDELLTKLIQDERQYNDLINENYVVKNYFNQVLNDEKITLLAYYDVDLIVGYILIRKLDDDVCLLDGLYVLEKYRNKGIGSKLLNEAIIRCKKYNVKYIDINVMNNNEVAKKIYKKMGFNEFEIKLRKNIE